MMQVTFLDLSFVAFFFLYQTKDWDAKEYRLKTEADLTLGERLFGSSIEYAEDTEETGSNITQGESAAQFGQVTKKPEVHWTP